MIHNRYHDYSREVVKFSEFEIISKKDLSVMTGRSLSTIERMVKDGRLPKPLRTETGRIAGWFYSVIEQWRHRQK